MHIEHIGVNILWKKEKEDIQIADKECLWRNRKISNPTV